MYLCQHTKNMDREKFIEIYKRYYPELCLFLGNFSADADKNKDIVQDR